MGSARQRPRVLPIESVKPGRPWVWLVVLGCATHAAAQAPEAGPPTPEAGAPPAQESAASAPPTEPAAPRPDASAAPAPASATVAPAAPAPAPASDAPAPSPPTSQVIEDPELAGVAPATAPSSDAGASESAEPSTGDARVVLRSRLGMDLGWDTPREEVWEATQLALIEATVRRSEDLRFVVGARMRHASAFREHDTVDADAARFELDLAPVSAYADATLTDGVHLRLGYQLVHLGRFDLFSATDVLSVVDLRGGPTTMPEAADIAQPAARVDWDAGSWLSLSAIYVPFFQPDPVEVFDTDYALVRPTQADVDKVIEDTAALDAALDEGDISRILLEGLSRSGRNRLVQGTLSAFAPDPDATQPQGGLRATAHGLAGEVAMTLATALERLPALAPSTALEAALDDPSQANLDALRREPNPVAIEYGRFFVVSADGATEAGPFLLGAEIAYQHDRTYLAAENGRLPQPQQTGVVQLGLRAEHAQGDEWLVGVESFASYALEEPPRSAARWTFVDGKRWRWGGAALVGYSPGAGRLTLELSGGVVTGPSLLVAPRVELRMIDTLSAELGAYFVEGPTHGSFGDPRATLGGLYDDVDQVFVGVKWVP